MAYTCVCTRKGANSDSGDQHTKNNRAQHNKPLSKEKQSDGPPYEGGGGGCKGWGLQGGGGANADLHGREKSQKPCVPVLSDRKITLECRASQVYKQLYIAPFQEKNLATSGNSVDEILHNKSERAIHPFINFGNNLPQIRENSLLPVGCTHLDACDLQFVSDRSRLAP